MINLAVINLKVLIRKTLKIIIAIILIAMIFKFIKVIYNGVKNSDIKIFNINNNVINENLAIFNYYETKKKSIEESGLKKILVSQLAVFAGVEEKNTAVESEKFQNEEIQDNIIEVSIEEQIQPDTNIEQVIQTVSNENLKTEVIEVHNKKDIYTDIYNTVQIKNESNYSLTENMIKPDITYSNTNGIIIYHTHTCESYTPTENFQYVASGNYRTIDLNYSVARVGSELTNYLAGKGYTVIHDTTYHDYPAYTGSYTRSLNTITNLLSTYNTVDAVFDIHRDALGNNSEYAPCVKIGDETVAQLMFVIGTDGGGLNHPNWIKNLKLAVKIQEKANEMYPGLFKPIILRNSRYNQHVTDGAAIIEVGATGNTLEQCNGSMKYLADVIDAVIK